MPGDVPPFVTAPPLPPGGLRAVLALLADARLRRSAVALAVVVETTGSTYRKAGALAAIAADGRRAGTLSGGCLEPELDRLAQLALLDGETRVATLDTRGDDDRLFGSGSACRGRMRVVVRPLRGERDAPLLAACAALERGTGPLRLAIVLDGPRRGDLAGAACGATFAARDAGHPQLADALAAALAAGPGCREARAGDETFEAAVVDVRAVPQLLVIGAGPEAPALTRIARELGWHVEVFDHRPALVDGRRLPGADRIATGRPGALLAARGDARLDAAVVMSHSAAVDLEALRALADAACPHVALLGPPARRDELLAELDPQVRTKLAPRLSAPAGVALGGEGPEAIALGIAAGLQRVFSVAPVVA